MSHDLNGSICNHLVGVHVGTGASTALNGVNHKLVIKIAASNIDAGLYYGVPKFGG